MTAQTPDGGGLGEEEREALMDACPVTICATEGDHDDLFAAIDAILAARLAGHAEEVRAAREGALEDAAEAMPYGVWSSAHIRYWLRERAAQIRGRDV